MKQKLTQERLKELLDYDPETGVFTWKVYKKNQFAKIGNKTGSAKDNGYHHITIDGYRYKAHRLAFLFMEGYFPENTVDHIDRDRSNNKWNNLREASRTCNVINRPVFKNTKIEITGITFNNNRKKYVSRIMINYKSIFLGSFDNILDAVKSRWDAEVKNNFPTCNTTSSAYNYLKEHGAI